MFKPDAFAVVIMLQKPTVQTSIRSRLMTASDVFVYTSYLIKRIVADVEFS